MFFGFFLLGVGRTMESKLASLGIKTCGDLQYVSMAKLQKEFGPKTGQMLYRFCRGLDDRPVRTEKERKSVSAEINYGIRFTQVNLKNIFLQGYHPLQKILLFPHEYSEYPHFIFVLNITVCCSQMKI